MNLAFFISHFCCLMAVKLDNMKWFMTLRCYRWSTIDYPRRSFHYHWFNARLCKNQTKKNSICSVTQSTEWNPTLFKNEENTISLWQRNFINKIFQSEIFQLAVSRCVSRYEDKSARVFFSISTSKAFPSVLIHFLRYYFTKHGKVENKGETGKREI